MKRIIDNKPILLTNDEYRMYKDICRSYDRPNFKGESLFSDHFETDNNGFIIFVKPPNKKHSSLEVYCFLVSLMTNQHIRLMHERIDAFIEDSKKNIFILAKDVEDKLKLAEKAVPKISKKKVVKAKKKTAEKASTTDTVKVRRTRRKTE